MNSLVDKCPNPEFWFHARPEFQLPSLAWFLTRDGRRYLNEKYATFNLELKKEVKEEIKVTESYAVFGDSISNDGALTSAEMMSKFESLKLFSIFTSTLVTGINIASICKKSDFSFIV